MTLNDDYKLVPMSLSSQRTSISSSRIVHNGRRFLPEMPVGKPRFEQKYGGASEIHTGSFSIYNYGEAYFFPGKELQKGLKEVLIFAENSKKREIPIGSVWTYDANTQYNPEILKDDIGCGITVGFIPQLEVSDKLAKDVCRVIDSQKIRLGGGNHFLDICTDNPFVKNSGMIVIHSDFNPEKKTPLNYEQAQAREQDARNSRIEALEKITTKLGLEYKLYKDFTHNSVRTDDAQVTYRKGATNVKETNGVVLVALNPYDGFYFLQQDENKLRGSMQRGVGKTETMGKDKPLFVESYGHTKYLVVKPEHQEALRADYMPINKFIEKFVYNGTFPIGTAASKLVIRARN